jgi:hypothetical protein
MKRTSTTILFSFTIANEMSDAWQVSQAIAPLLIGVVFMAMGRRTADMTEDGVQPQAMRAAA